jgi:phenylacetate-CoA ligase
MEAGHEEIRYFNPARETLPWEMRRQELERRFIETLHRALDHAPAYLDIYRAKGLMPLHISSLDEIERLPILRMADLAERQKERPPFGGFETLGSNQLRRIYVNPGFICQPGEQDYEDTSWAEALCAAGFGAGDRILNTFSYHLWPFAFMLDDSAKRIGATVIPSGFGNTLAQVRIMKALRVNGYLGTPSFIMTLLQRAEGMGLDVKKDLCLKKALVSAEMLPESLRSKLEGKPGMTVRQAYGTVLLGCVGYECRYRTGLHVPDNVYVEVVDPDTGKQVAPGAAGEIVVSSFSHAFPMIRLATGDLSSFAGGPCPCGRSGPVLTKILGRIDQAAKVKGTFIHPWQADEVMARFPDVSKYQVVITRKDHTDVMTFVVELRENAAEAARLQARMERDIKDALTVKGLVKIVPRGTLPDLHRKIEDRRTWE